MGAGLVSNLAPGLASGLAPGLASGLAPGLASGLAPGLLPGLLIGLLGIGGALLVWTYTARRARPLPDTDPALVQTVHGPLPEPAEDTPLDRLDFTVFDVATTGLLPHRDRILRIDARRFSGDRTGTAQAFDRLIDPDQPIPPDATERHGIAAAHVAGAPLIAEIAPRFHRFAQGSVLVAHNAPFQLAYLRRDARAMGLDWDMPVLDLVCLSEILFGQRAAHDMAALKTRFDIPPSPMARPDVAARILSRMLPLLMAQGYRTLPALLAETAKRQPRAGH